MAFGIKLIVRTAEFGPVLDKLLKMEGVTVEDWDLITAAPQNGKPKDNGTEKPAGRGGTQIRKVAKLVERAIGIGDEFLPKQILSLARSKGISDAAFYGSLRDLVRDGNLSRQEPGKPYKREK